MHIRDIYGRYQVPPWLQAHQVRVAAVGKMVAEAQKEPVDTDLVVSTCLIHDIGALVKFDFSYQSHETLRALCPPEDVPRWIEAQARIREKYGTQEYKASLAIIQELGLEAGACIFKEMGIQYMEQVVAGGTREAQAAQYGDMRVGPYGIVSIQERVADVTERYLEYWKQEGRGEESRRYPQHADVLEKALFANARIRPEDINDASAAPVIATLWGYEIV